MRGARAKVVTAAPIPTARRERLESGPRLQPARRGVEPARRTVTGTMPTATVMVRARPFVEALGWITRTAIERGKTQEEEMSSKRVRITTCRSAASGRHIHAKEFKPTAARRLQRPVSQAHARSRQYPGRR